MRFGPLPPIQIGGCGCCTGVGRSCASRSDTTLPVVGHHLAGEEPLHDLERVLEQVEALAVDGNGMPSSVCSLSNHAAPSDSSSRPCDAWSIVIAWAANTDGWR